MKVMVMHKQSAREEADIHPSPEFMKSMGSLIHDAVEAGVFRMGEGLRSSRHRTRVIFKDGERTLQNGPYTGGNELIAGFALLKVDSADEAVEHVSRIGAVLGDAEFEVGAVCEPWDLGLAPKPEGLKKVRLLSLHKATPAFEGGSAPSAGVIARVGSVMDDLKDKGVLQAAGALQPSSKAKRVRYHAGKRISVVDGPFAESKELIAGFSMFELASMDEALKWTDRFGGLFPEVEVDIRPLPA